MVVITSTLLVASLVTVLAATQEKACTTWLNWMLTTTATLILQMMLVVTFLQLIWATLLGALVFHESVDIWVVAGGTLILSAVSFIAWREAVLNRSNLTTPSIAPKL